MGKHPRNIIKPRKTPDSCLRCSGRPKSSSSFFACSQKMPPAPAGGSFTNKYSFDTTIMEITKALKSLKRQFKYFNYSDHYLFLVKLAKIFKDKYFA